MIYYMFTICLHMIDIYILYICIYIYILYVYTVYIYVSSLHLCISMKMNKHYTHIYSTIYILIHISSVSCNCGFQHLSFVSLLHLSICVFSGREDQIHPSCRLRQLDQWHARPFVWWMMSCCYVCCQTKLRTSLPPEIGGNSGNRK